ncbi:hypothetical protein ABT279_26670 [Amycolatopsis sp. NPDC000673]|uniref:hypothetical protein n=1 Tax=unclassified Amycolatopsis TaxID=2618356 RepID=UPI0033346B01
MEEFERRAVFLRCSAVGGVHAALALRSTSDTLTDDRLPWFLSRAQRCADALAVLLLEPGQRY